MRLRITAIALCAVGLAACGGSKATGVQAVPSSGATSANVPTPTTPNTPTTPTTPTVPPQLSKQPVVTPPTGPAPNHLVVKDLIKGTGAAVTPGASVTVNYVGVLYKNGKQFDSSWSRGQPSTFPLSGVIKGWSEGMVGMRVGGRRELIVPPSLGYKAAGSPPTIPPNAALVFVVDLLSVA
jgi:peptidylprolyl isomerase